MGVAEASITWFEGAPVQVRLLHDLGKIHATFDDPNLVSRAGLVPVMALAQRAGLAGLAGEQVRIARPCGVNAAVKGTANSARGAASFVAESVSTARAAGCTGTIVVRMDPAFYSAAACGAARAAGAVFSVTVAMNPHVRAVIAAIPGDAWTPIQPACALG
jgi:hypothetical protein